VADNAAAHCILHIFSFNMKRDMDYTQYYSHTSYIVISSFFPSLFLHSSELRGGSWEVIRVVRPDEIGRPDERLKAQMTELELSPQEGW